MNSIIHEEFVGQRRILRENHDRGPIDGRSDIGVGGTAPSTESHQAAGAERTRAHEDSISRPPAELARAIDRAHAAHLYLEEARRRRRRVISEAQPEIDAIADQRRSLGRVRELEGLISEAFQEEGLAEEALLEAIRRANPEAMGGREACSFRHRDGRTLIALADGHELDSERILEIPAGFQAGPA